MNPYQAAAMKTLAEQRGMKEDADMDAGVEVRDREATDGGLRMVDGRAVLRVKQSPQKRGEGFCYMRTAQDAEARAERKQKELLLNLEAEIKADEQLEKEMVEAQKKASDEAKEKEVAEVRGSFESRSLNRQ